jgi:hypothetical protein
MRIENQFMVRLGVVENGHLAIAYNHELLLLKGMQPANKNVSFDATLEGQDRQGHVGNGVVQIAGSLRRHACGSLAKKMEDRRDVMRGETPEDVFFCAKLSEVKPRGTDVFHTAQLAEID